MRRNFVKKYSGERLTPDQLERRSRVVLLAQGSFGSVAEALAFLNQPHEALGARPLDLATQSADGLAAVEAVMKDMASSAV